MHFLDFLKSHWTGFLSGEGTKYVLENVVSMTAVMVILITFQIFYFHFFLASQINSDIISKIDGSLQSMIPDALQKYKLRIQDNFFYVVQGVDFYFNKLQPHVDGMLTRAGQQEKTYVSGRQYQITFSEFMLIAGLFGVIAAASPLAFT